MVSCCHLDVVYTSSIELNFVKATYFSNYGEKGRSFILMALIQPFQKIMESLLINWQSSERNPSLDNFVEVFIASFCTGAHRTVLDLLLFVFYCLWVTFLPKCFIGKKMDTSCIFLLVHGMSTLDQLNLCWAEQLRYPLQSPGPAIFSGLIRVETVTFHSIFWLIVG